MRIFKSTALIAFAMIQVGASLPAYAANAQMVASAKGVMVTGDSRFGGCMVSLDTDPQTLLPACGKGWVSFDCSGGFPDSDVVRAYRMLDQAQLAIATRLRMRIEFSDEKMHNGYCVAHRVDVIR